MLDTGKTLGRFHNPSQAVIVKPVGGGARGPTIKHGSHRDRHVFFRNVLMNYVVGKAGERGRSTGKQYLDFIGGRTPPDAVERARGLVLG